MIFMPQISLYIDNDILTKVERDAKERNISVSRCVANTLKKAYSNEWPAGYEELFGILKDDDIFVEPPELDFADDVKRDSL